MRPTALQLGQKNASDAERIAQYKKQIAQLAACIADREGRIRRRLPIIERLSEREVASFQHRLAKLELSKSLLNPNAIYRTDDGDFILKHRGDGYYVVQDLKTTVGLYGGKDVQLLSDAFFFDYPTPKVILPNADT